LISSTNRILMTSIDMTELPGEPVDDAG
jgi:hypothetical protein